MKIKNIIYAFQWHFFPTAQMKHLHRFYRDNKDGAIIYRHPLNSESIVFDIGGYIGDFAAEIFARYGCRIELFEPIANHCLLLNERFQANPRVSIHPFALGEKTGECNFMAAADSSSSKRLNKGLIESCKIMEMATWWKKGQYTSCDLMKINIEGGEYALITHLQNSGILEKTERLLIQFHNFSPGDESRRNEAISILRCNHEEEYSVPFVWEIWRKKKS